MTFDSRHCKLFIAVIFFVVLLPLSSWSSTSEAKTKTPFDVFTLYWENDIFSGTDRDYTNGLKLSWSTPFVENRAASKLPEWSYSLLKMIPFAYRDEASQAFSFSIGQNIFTPEDTARSDLIVADRPYAGQMYLSFGVQNRYDNHKHSWELSLGLIGPDSHADDLQIWLHDRTGSDPARGWTHQLENEPTLDIVFETKWRLFRTQVTEKSALDVISHLGGRLGNVAVYGNGGLEIRYGLNLPDNFGICTIRGGCEIGSAFAQQRRRRNSLHLFVAGEGRAVAHDIFLDGNTLSDSHSVDREILVGEMIVGFAFRVGSISSTYSYIMRTRQFEGQNHSPDFGAVTVSISY